MNIDLNIDGNEIHAENVEEETILSLLKIIVEQGVEKGFDRIAGGCEKMAERDPKHWKVKG